MPATDALATDNIRLNGRSHSIPAGRSCPSGFSGTRVTLALRGRSLICHRVVASPGFAWMDVSPTAIRRTSRPYSTRSMVTRPRDSTPRRSRPMPADDPFRGCCVLDQRWLAVRRLRHRRHGISPGAVEPDPGRTGRDRFGGLCALQSPFRHGQTFSNRVDDCRFEPRGLVAVRPGRMLSRTLSSCILSSEVCP